MVTAAGWGGTVDLDYVHEKYWPSLVETCEKRREAWLAKWREMGGTIGLKEVDYKGGAPPKEGGEKVDIPIVGDSQNLDEKERSAVEQPAAGVPANS